MRRRRLHTRWMHDLPIRDGPGALKVNRLGAAGAPETGKQTCHGTFATDLPAGRHDIAGPAECARTRRTVENPVFPELKKFQHLERNFGHGSRTLSGVPAMAGMIALLMQSACRMVCSRWQAARRRWVARYRMPDQLKILADHVVFRDRDQYLVTIATDELPEQPPRGTAGTMCRPPRPPPNTD